MTAAERRIREFSSCMKKLSSKSRNYIHKLAHTLLLVEQPPVCPVQEADFIGKGKESKNTRMGF